MCDRGNTNLDGGNTKENMALKKKGPQMGPKWAPFSWGLRPEAPIQSAFGLQIYGPERPRGLLDYYTPFSQVPYFLAGSNFLAIHLNFWRLDLDSPDRDSMDA